MKAAFFDIDGTLVDVHSHKISNSTKEACKLLKANGYKIAVCSSRPYETIRIVDNIFDIEWDGIIGANGMDILDGQQNMIIDNSFTKDQLQSFFDIGKDNNIPMYVAGEDIFFTGMNDTVIEFIKHYGLKNPVVKEFTGQNQKLITFISYDKEFVMSKLKTLEGIDIQDAGKFNVDVFPKGLTKLSGIHQLMKYWNFEENDYISFGDSKSDEIMLKGGKIGVAMPNAIPSTKEIATYVYPEQSEDAIYLSLKELGII